MIRAQQFLTDDTIAANIAFGQDQKKIDGSCEASF